ncbi:endolytic transglycosylase MltG [Streptomyces sp. NPDC060194]|uniref:endolytic transglycosylase MltG n=1 Tax=Streptomyces sp. NPDC060194 TaxID=3347069 RepID=UPI00364AF96B
MTEYGRGTGPEPWHPEDPSHGDQGWDQYGGQQQQYPQQPQTHYPQQAQQQPDPYGYGYGYPEQQPQPQPQQQPYGGGWDTGQQPQQPQQQYQNPGYGDPYGGQGHPDPYGNQGGGTYGGQQPDYYTTPQAYPPPQPPNQRAAHPQQQAPQQQAPQPEPQSDWDAQVAEEPEHAFFADPDTDATPARETRDGDDGDDEPPRTARREPGGRKPKKRRNGMACLIVAVVFLGIGGGGAYYVYSFWQDRFGAAPDFAGEGSEPIEVEIPEGATGAVMGQVLKRAGVVKSVDAFIEAYGKDPNSGKLQPGVYSLNKEMSAENAMKAMVSPEALNNLIIPEGLRNVQIYAAIDKKLELKSGTTKAVAKKEAGNLGLPEWADGHKQLKDPLEGFLFPLSYSVSKNAKPEDVLKKMVAQANSRYEELDLEGQASKLGLEDPWQVLTVASLVQAEGISHDDFRKMSEVVYNRLKPDNDITNRKLEFDSAFNYLNNQSEIKISSKEIRSNPDPYNTYYHTGLPPGPISNPGEDALKATLNPTKNGWMFFISLDGKTTKFTTNVDDHEKLNDEFKRQQGLD